MEKFFSFEEETNDFLTLIYKGLTGESLKGTPESVKDKNKNCKIVSREPLVEYIRSIVGEFEKLVLYRDD